MVFLIFTFPSSQSIEKIIVFNHGKFMILHTHQLLLLKLHFVFHAKMSFYRFTSFISEFSGVFNSFSLLDDNASNKWSKFSVKLKFTWISTISNFMRSYACGDDDYIQLLLLAHTRKATHGSKLTHKCTRAVEHSKAFDTHAFAWPAQYSSDAWRE